MAKDKRAENAKWEAIMKRMLNDEPPREWIMSVMDTLREFGGRCTDNCGHFDWNGRSRDRLDL